MTCPRCQCPDCRAAHLDPIDARAAELLEACRVSGIPVRPGDKVTEEGAAQLFGLSPKTLANARYALAPIASYEKIRGRVWYRLADLAAVK